MQSNIFDRISFVSLFITIVLLPVFFIPFSKIPIETSKSLLVVLGVGIAIIFWAIARFFDGRVGVPKSLTLLAGFGIAVAFLLSAIFSPAVSWSLFGTMLDVGSFWFIFICFAAMFVSAAILRDARRAQMVLWGMIISFTAVLLFQIVRLATSGAISFGVLTTLTDNIFGSWNALGVLAGLLGIVSLFMIEFLPMAREKRWGLTAFLAFSFFFVALVNFSFVVWLLGIFALIIFVFKILTYIHTRQAPDGRTYFPWLPLLVLVGAIIFLLSGSPVRGFLPEQFGTKTSSIEIRPPFSSTVSVAVDTIKERPIFGAGPNRFGEMWAMHKPVELVNSGLFWDVYFDFGWGLLPTFAVTTGILGILTWLWFLLALSVAGMKSVFSSIRNGTNYDAAVFFLAAFYIFITSFFYVIGPTLLILAFILAGGFIGLRSTFQQEGEVSISFLDDPRKSFFAIVFLVLLVIAVVVASFKFTERFVSVGYFGKTLITPDVSEAESSISRALSLNLNDLYLRTYAQVYLIKLNSQATENPNPTEEESAVLQEIFDKAVNGAVLATTYNPTNYLNFVVLGNVYNLAGSLGVTGAPEKAVEAYRVASNLNPGNPGIKFSMARASFTDGKKAEAREYARDALTLKPNYIEAMIFLSQMAKSDGDIKTARSYAERALSFSPGNKDLIKYLESLGNSSSSPATTEN